MSAEFFVESHISSKQLNHQSVSLVVPRLARDKIHNNIYYKANLSAPSLRGETFEGLVKVLVRDFGTLSGRSVNQVNTVGGIAFKCTLMKMIEIRPTVQQLMEVVKVRDGTPFDNKYIAVLVLVYIRLQYYYLPRDNADSQTFKQLFKECLKDYRKVKAINLDQDCLAISQSLEVKVVHIDEVVERLAEGQDIWGLPLGKCTWCDLYTSDDQDSSDSDSDSSEDEST